MGAQLRVYRRRIRSVASTKKITRAMELISASRVIKARHQVAAATPYAEELTRALTAAASYTTVDHPLTTERPNPARAAMLVVTSDRGLAGAYTANVLKQGESLATLLRSENKEVAPYLVGRKGIAYYTFRNRPIAGQWSGFTEKPSYADAKRIAATLLEAFLASSQSGGVDEIHVVYTTFVTTATQQPTARRVLPLEVETTEQVEGPMAAYEFEPSGEVVLDALLPQYVTSRIYHALLQAAASEHAARRRAMKAATDNADELIQSLTRRANTARQAEITQEISEIVSGANALTAAGTTK